ncbi:MAG TPA: TonB-dependent receptor, partial [Sphingobacteriaceae bacterium]
THERPIASALPADYFGVEQKSATAKVNNFDYSDYEKRQKRQKTLEEKVYSIGLSPQSSSSKATIAGTVMNASNGEPIVGASIFVEDESNGVATDVSGFYSITLSKGKHTMRITSLGMKATVRQVLINGNGKLNIELEEDVTPLKEVVVESDRDQKVMGLQMGTEKLDIKTMKQMPSVLGEVDVLKVVLTLPGVQSVGEGSSGVNIRGGATNQNLILYNDAVVYNPSHLFGFFSAFNPDILKSVELYKSGVNAEYGGRLSAVLDVVTKEGNLKKFSASGGISPITGRLMIEGPIKKDRTSFLVSGRSTYSDWLLRRLNKEQFKNSSASFYDVNATVSHKINDKNSVQASVYQSYDEFQLDSDTLYSYGERNGSLKFKHVFNNKLYAIATGSFSRYHYAVSTDENPAEASEMKFSINQLNGKADFSYFQNARQTITAGIQATRYDLSPGSRTPLGEASNIEQNVLQDEQGLESALYVGENIEITQKLSVYGGLRYSFYQFLGPKDVFTYHSEGTKSVATMVDTLSFGSGKPVATYHGAEPRLSARFLIGKSASLKFSYNRMRQYIQMLSNTTAIAPTDIWKLADKYIRPQVGDQYSLGYYVNLKGGSFEFSSEVYYKTMKDVLDYKNGAQLFLNHHIETDAVSAEGKAYGAEFMIKKPAGKLNGWFSYTYSRTFLRTVSDLQAETVNSGRYYPSNYDKPHAVNFISNYKFNRRFNFSLNCTYSTGRPITIPLAKYEVNGVERT